MGERTGAYRVLVKRSEVKRPFGRPRWKDNIKMDLKKWDWGGGGGSWECSTEPLGSIKYVSFSERLCSM